VGHFPSNSLERQYFTRTVLQHSTQQVSNRFQFHVIYLRQYVNHGGQAELLYNCSAHEKQSADTEDSNLLAE